VTESGPTGREWGDLSRHVEEIRHDIRNMRTIVDGYTELIIELERRCSSLETKIYTSIGVCVVFFSLAGFLVNLFF
jgi:uncharacterized membrane protein